METQNSIAIEVENPTYNVKEGNENNSNEEESDRENECAICLDKWKTTGTHMATKLKCGHIFGYTCIREWVNIAGNCPVCKCRNAKHQLRRLYQRVRSNRHRCPTSGVNEASSHEGPITRSKRRLARSRSPTAAGTAADERHGENAEPTESQDSQENDPGTVASCNSENGVRTNHDSSSTSGVNEDSSLRSQTARGRGRLARSRSPADAIFAAIESIRERAEASRSQRIQGVELIRRFMQSNNIE